MSKLTSRFIANAQLWDAIREHVTKAKSVRAAVAYFGRNGAKFLPLKRGTLSSSTYVLGLYAKALLTHTH
jgi:hypothetical protein